MPQDETEILMRQLRDPAKLAEVWTKWHDHAKTMKADYVRMVEIANEARASLVIQTSDRCGARAMTCRLTPSPPRPTGSGDR